MASVPSRSSFSTLTVRIPADLADACRDVANTQSLSLNKFAEQALRVAMIHARRERFKRDLRKLSDKGFDQEVGFNLQAEAASADDDSD